MKKEEVGGDLRKDEGLIGGFTKRGGFLQTDSCNTHT